MAANTGILDDHLYASESDFGAGPVWRFDTDNPVLMETAMPVLEVLGIEKGGGCQFRRTRYRTIAGKGRAYISIAAGRVRLF